MGTRAHVAEADPAPAAAEAAIAAPASAAILGAPWPRGMTPAAGGVSNAAIARAILARCTPEGGEAKAPGLPNPGDPGHREAFDALVAQVCADSTIAGLSKARQAVDRPAPAATETIGYGGASLVVDARNLSAVLTRIRWRAMDRIHELLTAGKAASDAEVQSYLRFLYGEEGGRIQDSSSAVNRLEHWNRTVQASVLSVAQQRVAAAATASFEGTAAADANSARKNIGTKWDTVTDPDTGKKVSVDTGEQAAWCGAFAALMYNRAGGSAANMKAMGHEESLRNHFEYKDAQKIDVDGQVMEVKAYHAQRGSLRSVVRFPDVITDPAAIDLRPGDIVLEDNYRGLNPDHIQTCVSYDRTNGNLVTVGGNEGQGDATRTIVNRSDPRDLRAQPAPNEVAARQGKHVRVWGRARWSVVDFEPHSYPTK